MENSEEILHSLEEFSKLKPKDIPRELEDYLCFVAKTGDPVYQWPTIKCLFREKIKNVITEFYESCPNVDIPSSPNVENFHYELMKSFILEKLDTFSAAPFTVQRICELLTAPRKEYNRIDKYMRALEKTVLVVSTVEPGNRRSAENGEGIVNGLETEHLPETNNTNSDINVEEIEMDERKYWPHEPDDEPDEEPNEEEETEDIEGEELVVLNKIAQGTFISETRTVEAPCSSTIDSVITCKTAEQQQPYVSIEPVASDSCSRDNVQESDVSVTITAIPAAVQKRRDSIEPVVSSVEEKSPTSAIYGNEEIPPAENAENTSVPCQKSEAVDSTNSTTVTREEQGQQQLANNVTLIEVMNVTEYEKVVIQISKPADLLPEDNNALPDIQDNSSQAVTTIEPEEEKETPSSSEEVTMGAAEPSDAVTPPVLVTPSSDSSEVAVSEKPEESPKEETLISSTEDEIKSDVSTSELKNDLVEHENVPKHDTEEVSVTNSNIDDNALLESIEPQLEQTPTTSTITTEPVETVSNSEVPTSMEVDTEEFPQQQQESDNL